MVDRRPLNRWVARLEQAGLGDADAAALQALCDHVRHVPARQPLVVEGDRTDSVLVLLKGWAARTKQFPDDRRQFTALLVPGDVCNLGALHVRRQDHRVTTLTACDVAVVGRRALGDLAASSRRIAEALGWLACVEQSIADEWLACLGRRSAREHLAHLLCELLLRLSAVGEGERDGFLLPLTQEELADAMGLTPVHVNRTLQSLRTDRLVGLESHRLRMLDWAGMTHVAGFRPDYLHLDGLRPID